MTYDQALAELHALNDEGDGQAVAETCCPDCGGERVGYDCGDHMKCGRAVAMADALHPLDYYAGIDWMAPQFKPEH